MCIEKNTWRLATFRFVMISSDLRRYSPENLADQLTLMNRNLFLQIRPEEIEHFRFCSSRLAPNVSRLFQFYNRLVALFATEILKQPTEKSRVSVIVHLFLVSRQKTMFLFSRLSPQTIRQLYLKNHDIHSLRTILAAFDHPSVYQLQKTWRKFRLDYPKFYTFASSKSTSFLGEFFFFFSQSSEILVEHSRTERQLARISDVVRRKIHFRLFENATTDADFRRFSLLETRQRLRRSFFFVEQRIEKQTSSSNVGSAGCAW